MDPHKILGEAGKLRSVSHSLEQLAAENEPMADALTVLAGTVRQSAAILEVIVELRLGGADGFAARGNADVEKRSN